MTALSAYVLPPPDRALFSTSSRLLSCLVTEGFLRAFFIPVFSSLQEHTIGTAVVLTFDASNHDGPYNPEDVFALLPLRHTPILKPRSIKEIGLIDPLDMLPYVYEVIGYSSANPHHNGDVNPASFSLEAELLAALSRANCETAHVSIAHSPGPLHLWKKFADGSRVDKDVQETIAKELHSSVEWQQYSYENPPPQAPTFDSPSIAWEQCITEGHPTHPMHKCRMLFPPNPPSRPGDYNWQQPLLRLAAVPRTSLSIHGPWDELLAPLYVKAAENAGKPINIPSDYALVPIRDLQVLIIREKLPEVQILPEEYHVDALAQQSLGTILVPSALRSLSLKLPLDVCLTSHRRIVPCWMTLIGPKFSSQVAPLLTYDRTLLIVQCEPAGASLIHSDIEVASHLSGIVRNAYENTSVEEHGERVIVCTALVELGYGGPAEIPLVQSVFGLDTEEKRIVWFERYADMYLKAFLPPVVVNGVAFEAHPQNTLARFDVHTRELKGFLIRDLAGLRLHAATLMASTGLKTLDGIIAPERNQIIVDTPKIVYARMYRSHVHNHLQQLVRVLRLHYNGLGWGIIRRCLNEQIPEGHDLAKFLLTPEAETVYGMGALMLRKLHGTKPLRRPFPNLIQHQGDGQIEIESKIVKIAAMDGGYFV